MSVAPPPSSGVEFHPSEEFARQLDASDPLAAYRERFVHPQGADGAPLIYFCGNSLGLMPREVNEVVKQELHDWATLAVEGHFRAKTPWYSYHDTLRQPLADLVGASPVEVVAMNGLTVNLHLMLVSFYRPTAERHKILIEDKAFPSDRYAIQSQLRWHGHDPASGLLEARPREGEASLRTEDVEALLDERGPEIAVVMFGGVNYYTGQLFDMRRITAAARRQGCFVGFDLAHAVGNVPLALHDWDVDFGVWCSYKYLNGGPGSVGGAFVHERHGRTDAIPRFAGWWGNDPETRFQMPEQFVPRSGADGWQVSNPPILSMAALRPALAMFSQAGMPALQQKSAQLTGYLEYLVDRMGSRRVAIITPRDHRARGCQLSLRVHGESRRLYEALSKRGVVSDFREPDVIRVAPVPLYNTFGEVWRFGEILRSAWHDSPDAGGNNGKDD